MPKVKQREIVQVQINTMTGVQLVEMLVENITTYGDNYFLTADGRRYTTPLDETQITTLIT